MIARQGRPIDAAARSDARKAAEPATEGNATIALALRDLNEGRISEVEALLDPPNPNLNFAAATRSPTTAAARQDEALLTRLSGSFLRHRNLSLGNGIAGSILAAIKRKDPKGPFVQSILKS